MIARSLDMRLCRKGAFHGQIPCHLDEDTLCQEPCLKICGLSVRHTLATGSSDAAFSEKGFNLPYTTVL